MLTNWHTHSLTRCEHWQILIQTFLHAFIWTPIRFLTLWWRVGCSALWTARRAPFPPQEPVLSLSENLQQERLLLGGNSRITTLTARQSKAVIQGDTELQSCWVLLTDCGMQICQSLLKLLLQVQFFFGVASGEGRQQKTDSYWRAAHREQHSTRQLTDIQSMVETDSMAEQKQESLQDLLLFFLFPCNNCYFVTVSSSLAW